LRWRGFFASRVGSLRFPYLFVVGFRTFPHLDVWDASFPPFSPCDVKDVSPGTSFLGRPRPAPALLIHPCLSVLLFCCWFSAWHRVSRTVNRLGDGPGFLLPLLVNDFFLKLSSPSPRCVVLLRLSRSFRLVHPEGSFPPGAIAPGRFLFNRSPSLQPTPSPVVSDRHSPPAPPQGAREWSSILDTLFPGSRVPWNVEPSRVRRNVHERSGSL